MTRTPLFRLPAVRSTARLRRLARPLAVLLTTFGTLAASTLAYGDGIDISHWQGSVNWDKVRSDDVTFAFMKATEGTGYADPTLQRNWAGAEQVGIYRSAYHFARPSKGSAVAQARFFVSKAGTFSDPGDLPPVLDLEATGGLSPTDLRSWVSTWLVEVERLTGRTPILYFSPYFWIDRMGDSKAFARYPLWIAHYGTTTPRVPGGWSSWTFWQRTSSGRVDGIAGNVDMNRFNGTVAQLRALARLSGGTEAPVTPGPTVPTGAATALTLTPSTSTPAVDAPVTFSGTLSRTTPTTAVANRTVSLWSRRTGGAWTQVTTGVTSSSGAYSVTAKVSNTAAYQARFTGDPTYAASVSVPLRLTTPAPAAVALTLRAEKATVRKGAPLMIYGHLTSASKGIAGEEVRYYKRTPGSATWVYVGRAKSLAPTGWHSITIRPKVTRQWKVVYAGSARLAPRTSGLLTVTPR